MTSRPLNPGGVPTYFDLASGLSKSNPIPNAEPKSFDFSSLSLSKVTLSNLTSLIFRDAHHDPQTFQDDMIWAAALCVFWLVLWRLMQLLDLSSLYPKNGENSEGVKIETSTDGSTDGKAAKSGIANSPKSKSDLDFRNRLVTSCHSHVVLPCVTYCYFVNSFECGSVNTPFQRTVMAYSMTYFVTDIITMAVDGLLEMDMIIHHSLCVFAMVLPLYENIQGDYTMGALFLAEISNPLMTYRHLLKNIGRRHTKAYEFCEIGFMLMYLAARFVFIIPISVSTATCPDNSWIFKFAMVGLLVQSFFMGAKMVKILKHRYRELKRRSEAGIQLRWFEPLSGVELEKVEEVKRRSGSAPVVGAESSTADTESDTTEGDRDEVEIGI